MLNNHFPDLQQRLAGSLARHASRDALSTPTGPLTYAELDQWACRVAGALSASGARQGWVVSVAVEERFALAASRLACLRTGTVFMPLDLTNPDARLAAMLATARPD